MPAGADSGGPALGLVAGDGRLPFALARAARAEGHRVVAVGHQGVTDPLLAAEVDALSWVKIGQLKKIAEVFKTNGVFRAIFAGGLAKGGALRNARPDLEAIKLWAGLTHKGDDQLLKAIAGWFDAEGISIVEPGGLLRGCFAEKGLIAGPKPAPADLEEAARGVELCRALGKLDIGQTVALRDGMVLAVEAMEGTDACITRAGEILERAVVVKMLKPGQDLRFDLPTIGPRTLEVLAKSKGSAAGGGGGVDPGAGTRGDWPARPEGARLRDWSLGDAAPISGGGGRSVGRPPRGGRDSGSQEPRTRGRGLRDGGEPSARRGGRDSVRGERDRCDGNHRGARETSATGGGLEGPRERGGGSSASGGLARRRARLQPSAGAQAPEAGHPGHLLREPDGVGLAGRALPGAGAGRARVAVHLSLRGALLARARGQRALRGKSVAG